jgi:hypothetical protein
MTAKGRWAMDWSLTAEPDGLVDAQKKGGSESRPYNHPTSAAAFPKRWRETTAAD